MQLLLLGLWSIAAVEIWFCHYPLYWPQFYITVSYHICSVKTNASLCCCKPASPQSIWGFLAFPRAPGDLVTRNLSCWGPNDTEWAAVVSPPAFPQMCSLQPPFKHQPNMKYHHHLMVLSKKMFAKHAFSFIPLPLTCTFWGNGVFVLIISDIEATKHWFNQTSLRSCFYKPHCDILQPDILWSGSAQIWCFFMFICQPREGCMLTGTDKWL